METSRETSSQLSAVTCTNSDLWCQGPWLSRTDRSIRAYGARSFNRPAYFLENRNSTRYRNPLHGTASSALSCTFKRNLYFSCFSSAWLFRLQCNSSEYNFSPPFLTSGYRALFKLIHIFPHQRLFYFFMYLRMKN